jgi:5-methylthioadenosine/S-adenosylhomocysteine deaminase
MERKEHRMILSASWVIPISSSFLKDGAVLVRRGLIEDFGPASALLEKYPEEGVRGFTGSVLLPGLINVHTHLELTVLQGLVKPRGFWPWLRELVRIKHQVLAPADLYWSARLGAVECLKAGTTTVGEAMDTGDSLDALIEAGLRGVVFQEVFGKDPREAGQAMEGLEQKMTAWAKKLRNWPGPDSERQPAPAAERLRLGISPHSPYIVSPSLLQQSTEYARKNGIPVSLHAAESEAERLFIREGLGPIADYFREQRVPWDAPGGSTLQYLARTGILNPETQLVHCLQMEATDFELLARSGASVAHCPGSNLQLHSQIMQLDRMRELGIRVGLGSDSLASNNTLNLWKEMRLVHCLHSQIRGSSPDEPPSPREAMVLLRMATLGGAESLGLQSTVGSIEKGKAADLIAVNLTNVGEISDPAVSLIFADRPAEVHFAMVGGRILLEYNRIQSMDEGTTREKVAESRERIGIPP